MKKILWIALAIALIIPLMAMAGEAPVLPLQTPAPSLIVDFRAAIDGALIEVPGVVKDFSVEEEDGKAYYELEIVQESGNEFDVKVDMLSGDVLRKRDEGLSPRHADYLAAGVTYLQAVDTALAALPNARLEGFEMDRDRDALRYEVTLIDENGIKNDIHIDALTGEIVSSEADYKELPDGIMALADVEKIALERAIGVLYIQLDREDGEWEYEAHVISADGNYGELEIDAEDGRIKKEDWDD